MAARFPKAYIKRGTDSIAYFPDDPNGFVVRLTVLGRAKNLYRVYYDGSSEDFTSRKWAILQFAQGLSTGCRLREYSCFGKPYRWVVELWDERNKFWKPDWDCVRWKIAASQFLRRPVVRYLQNHLIDPDTSDLSCAA